MCQNNRNYTNLVQGENIWHPLEIEGSFKASKIMKFQDMMRRSFGKKMFAGIAAFYGVENPSTIFNLNAMF